MTLSEAITQWVVNDYFTPNIKAEVILDTLLTPYVAELIDRCYDLKTVFVTKEMSVLDETRTDDRGEKIDYILADENTVYLVELKTTDGSIDKTQAEKYVQNCEGKTFGSVFGNKLLKIMSGKTNTALEASLEKEEQLLKLFESICHGVPGNSYAERGKRVLKANPKWRSTYKYLFTMGQLLDYLYEPDGQKKAAIWDKKLELIYITPTGSLPHEDLEQHKDFYKGSVSLVDAGKHLAEKEDELSQLLADIIKDIYGR